MGELDVLNEGEMALLDLVEADIRRADEGPGGSKLLLRDIVQLAGIARRLVSEVERLRARNEALERVAKAAELIKCAGPVDYADRVRLSLALSAIAEPGKGGAT